MWSALLDALFGAVLGSVFLLALAILIERVAPLEQISMRERIPGILMNIVGTAGGIVLVWPLSVLFRSSEIAPWMTIPLWSWLEPLGMVGFALQFLLLLVVADFLAYWRHRAEHSKWLWPVHAVHHSPTELHAANSLGHPGQALFSYAFIVVPLSLIQFSGPAVPLGVALFVAFLAIYIHSPVDLHFGPVRRVIVDNRFHRIHHSLEPRHFDKNFGICFSFWDHLFGTAYQPGEEWPAVGLRDVRAPRTLRDFVVLPLPLYRSVLDREKTPELSALGVPQEDRPQRG